MCHQWNSVKFRGFIEKQTLLCFYFLLPACSSSKSNGMRVLTESLYLSDTARHSTPFKWALQTGADLAGKMNFKKKCHFNQGFWICLLSRSVTAQVEIVAAMRRETKLENLDAALCSEEGTDRIASRCLN